MSYHAVLTAVGLFALTFLSPGPNLFLIVQTSLSQGKSAGIAAGAGVATGDAIYAALGLVGLATIIATSHTIFAAIQILGGAYLIWYGFNLFRQARGRTKAVLGSTTVPTMAASAGVHFRRGMLTDLANAQTALFFVSIFSVTITPSTEWPTKLAIWVGISLTSMLWRVAVSLAFSRPLIRRGYMRVQAYLEQLVGVVLMGFGVKLIISGFKSN
ncbi:homoserine/threonine efflux transporter [Advenella mimigardefordensis]|uniref:Putative homoserine/threonine efflux protein n=1 Tax=Advenella mimigardefordensis (strain DSM 17166 / LMG 22922 / DPN7) TaxID=1247726 RepID=W0PDK1_ADVMD|nr:homoserine/threonine efflux transporter [Advenella mimigardefordensis]AHG64949.1 putative homoserine/threonine efflux protein [Advenella mimigardefordensis DPN7]